MKKVMGYYLGIACQGNLALPKIDPPETTVKTVLEIMLRTNYEVVQCYTGIASKLVAIRSYPISHENPAFSTMVRVMPRPSDLRLPLLKDNGFDISDSIHPEAIYNLVLENFSKENKDNLIEKSHILNDFFGNKLKMLTSGDIKSKEDLDTQRAEIEEFNSTFFESIDQKVIEHLEAKKKAEEASTNAVIQEANEDEENEDDTQEEAPVEEEPVEEEPVEEEPVEEEPVEEEPV